MLSVHTPASPFCLPAPVSALDLLREERSRRHIKTLCPELDELLGGGVAPGEITEICGGPGLGKTQLCIQLAVNAQLPVEFGGVGGDTLYIDTEGSLMPERVADMAASAGAHLRMHYTAGGGGQGQQQALPPFVDAWTPDAVLSRIHVYRAHDAVTQTAICAALPGLIAARPRVKLVVLDSVAFHYRHGWSSDYAARARSLAACFNSMLKFAAQHGIAVVVTNQVTTKPGAAGVGGLMGGGSKLAPALGESFAHCATCRLLLFWQHRSRCALLFKSPRQPRGTAAYAITPDGVRPLRTLKRHATDAAAPGRQ